MSEQNQTTPSVSDPSVIAWSSLAPSRTVPAPPVAEEPPQNEWRWGWSPWIIAVRL